MRFNINDIGVSNAILLVGANTGQISSYKKRDLACDVEQPPLKNCKDLTMKLEVKYFFPTSSFIFCELPEGLEMRKILAHGI